MLASHSFKLTSKSTGWMLGRPRPCEVASHSFKLTSKLTSCMLGCPRPPLMILKAVKFHESTLWQKNNETR